MNIQQFQAIAIYISEFFVRPCRLLSNYDLVEGQQNGINFYLDRPLQTHDNFTSSCLTFARCHLLRIHLKHHTDAPLYNILVRIQDYDLMPEEIKMIFFVLIVVILAAASRLLTFFFFFFLLLLFNYTYIHWSQSCTLVAAAKSMDNK